jgi:hypothetical protein
MTPLLNLDAVLVTIATPGASPKVEALPDFAALVAAARPMDVTAPTPMIPGQSVEIADVPAPIVEAAVCADARVVVPPGFQPAVPPVETTDDDETVKTLPLELASGKPKLDAPEQAVVRLPKPIMAPVAPVPVIETFPAEAADRPLTDDEAVGSSEAGIPTIAAETVDPASVVVAPTAFPVVADLGPQSLKEKPKADNTMSVSTPQSAVRAVVRREEMPVTSQPAQPAERRAAQRGAEHISGVLGLPDAGPRAPGVVMAAAPSSEAGSSMPDRRAPEFPAQIVHLARDVVAVSAGEDVQFSVRPAFLGQVSVTIERSDDGPSLRLGVETQAAAQAVKQAEPMLNTLASPFVQVSVDLNSPGQRERSAKTAAFLKRGREIAPDPTIEQAAIKVGRFA